MRTPKRIDRSRTLILEAACQAFQGDGYESATLEAVALAAGLTRKTVYNLFGSKEELALGVIACVEAADAGYQARLAADEPALEILERVLRDSAGWCLANPGLARLALAPRQRPQVEPPPDRPSFHGLVRDILILGQKQAVIRADEAPGLLALVLLAVYGQAMLSALAQGGAGPADISTIIRLVVQGIGPASDQSATSMARP